jgi:trigger factor
MQINVEKLSPVLVEFQVEIPADKVKVEVDKAYVTLQRTARVRGYRPGKAPRQVLAHIYSGRIHADVAQKLVDSTLNQALAEKQVQPLSQPAIAKNELKPDDAFSYKARFEVRPDIASVKWQGFQVRRPAAAATEAMIDEAIAQLRREHATLQAPDPERPAKAGDVVSISFTLEIDGKLREGGAQEIETEIGSGEVFKEFEVALTGMSPGETKPVEVTFHDRHPQLDLRGKKGMFTITAKEVKERILPDVDDEFAKDCGDYENLAALREAQKVKIEKELKQKANDAVAEQLVIELCRANPIPVPPTLVDQQAQLTEREITTAARRQGQRGDVTPELRQRVRADAEVKVRAGLLMAEIAKEKQIKITESDIEKGYEELAEQTGKNVAKVKAEYRDQKKREQLVGMILEDKVLDFLEGAATIIDSTEGAAAKSEPEAEASKSEPEAEAAKSEPEAKE